MEILNRQGTAQQALSFTTWRVHSEPSALRATPFPDTRIRLAQVGSSIAASIEVVGPRLSIRARRRAKANPWPGPSPTSAHVLSAILATPLPIARSSAAASFAGPNGLGIPLFAPPPCRREPDRQRRPAPRTPVLGGDCWDGVVSVDADAGIGFLLESRPDAHPERGLFSTRLGLTPLNPVACLPFFMVERPWGVP